MPYSSSPTLTGPSASTSRSSGWKSLPGSRTQTRLSCGLPRSGNHHDLGLFGVGPDAARKVAGGVGLYHLAWQLDTIEELAEARRTLIEAGAYTGQYNHGSTRSIYRPDPDGDEFELMWMLPRHH